MKRYFIYTMMAIFALSACTTSKKIEQDDDFATDSTNSEISEPAQSTAEPSQSTADVSEFDLDEPAAPPAEATAKPAEKDEFSDFDTPAAEKQTEAASTEQPPAAVDEFAEFDNQQPATPAEQAPVPAEQPPVAMAENADSKLENELNSLDGTPPPGATAAAPSPVETPIIPVVPETPMPIVEAQKSQVAPEPPAKPLAKIEQVFYRPNQNGGAVTIEGDQPLQFTTRLNAVTNQLVVEIQNSVIPSRLKRSLNTKDMASSIGSVDIYQKANSKVSRFVIQLRPGAQEPLVQPEGNSLLIIGAANEAYVAKQKADAEKAAATAKLALSADGYTDLSSDGIMGTQSLEEFLVGNQRFYGKKISIETNNLDIKEAIRFIAEESGANLLMDDGLTGQISLRLRQVPWDQALILILKAKKLGYVRQGNVLRIAKLADLQTEELEAYRLLESRRSNVPMIVKRFFISYAVLSDIQAKIREFIISTTAINNTKPIGGTGTSTPATAGVPMVSSSPGAPSTITTAGVATTGTTSGTTAGGGGGTLANDPQALARAQVQGRVIADERTGTLIVTDTPDNMAKIEKLIAALDTQPKQIVLETRIISATESFSKSIGFTWTSSGSTTSPNAAKLGITNSGLGASAPLNSTFSWKNLDVIGNLDAIISLGEMQEKVKVLNTQRNTVTSGKVAKIGVQSKLRIPITTTSAVGSTAANTSGFETVEYGLSGSVTPQASNENTITADIDLKQIQLQNAQGNTSDNQLGGRVVAQSGQTVAVNASFESTNTINETGVPGLKDVPVLGMLFKGKSEVLKKAETLVFITMTVLEPVTGIFKKAAGEISPDQQQTQPQ